MSGLRSLLTPAILAARRIRSDLPLTAAVFGVVLVTSFVFAAAPRAFESNADEGLRFAVRRRARSSGTSRSRGQAASSRRARIPLDAVSAAGTRLAQSFPESVREVIRNRRDTVETTRYTAVDAPGVPGPAGTTRLMTLEYVQGAADRIRLVAGRMPEKRDEIVPLPFRLGQPKAPLVEVAVPLAAANQLSLEVGDVLYLEPDFEDVLVGAVPLSERRMIAAEVTGIFSPKTDADARLARRRAPRRPGDPRHGSAPLRLRLRPLRAVGLRRGGRRDGPPAAALLVALRRRRERLRRGHDRPVGVRRAQAGRELRGVDVRPAARDGRTHRAFRGAHRLSERPGRGRRGDRDRRSRPPGARARRRRPSRRPRGKPPRREHRARPLARRRVVAGARRRGRGRDRGRTSGRAAGIRDRPRARRWP